MTSAVGGRVVGPTPYLRTPTPANKENAIKAWERGGGGMNATRASAGCNCDAQLQEGHAPP